MVTNSLPTRQSVSYFLCFNDMKIDKILKNILRRQIYILYMSLWFSNSFLKILKWMGSQ